MTKKTKEALLATTGFTLLIGIPAVWGNWDAIHRKYDETFHPVETAAEDAKIEVEFTAATRIVERHLLTDVDQAGNSFVGYDGQQRFLIQSKTTVACSLLLRLSSPSATRADG